MSQNLTGGLSLAPAETGEGSAVRLLLPMAAAALASAGLYGTLGAAFRWAGLGGFALVCVFGVCFGLLSLYLMAGRGTRAAVFAALMAAVLLFCAVFAARVRSGGAVLLNSALESLAERRGRIVLFYQTGDHGHLWASLPGAAVVGALIAAASFFAPWLGAPLLAAAWIPAALGMIPAGPWLFVYSLGCVLMLLSVGMRRCAGRPGRTVLQAACVCAAVFAVLAGAAALSGWGGGADALRVSAERAVHRLRYEPGPQPLAEGDFSARSGAADLGKTMLTVTLSRPESMYLRSFTGERYTDRGWETLGADTSPEERELFYWLHKNGFYGENQLALLAETLGEEREPIAVTVRTEAACRASRIVPNELEGDGLLLADRVSGSAAAPGLTGAETYGYTAQPDLTGRAYELLKTLEERMGDPSLVDYLSLEEGYRNYVYSRYLEIPADAEEILAMGLAAPEERLTTWEAKRLVRDLLAGHTSYSDAARPVSGGAEELADFLSGGEGDSARYASAAALLLRRCGVPARYCEGYLLTPGDVSGGEGETTVALTGYAAHAWAEYYEDGVGWIPFETAEPFLGLMSESKWQWFVPDSDSPFTASGLEGEIAGGWEALAESRRQEREQQEQEESPPPESESGSGTVSGVTARAVVLRLLIGLLILLAILAVLLIVRRARMLKRREASFRSGDVSRGLSAVFAHTMQLMWAGGLERTGEPLCRRASDAAAWYGEDAGFARVSALNDEAMYSTHALREEDRQEALRYRARVLEKAREKMRFSRRLYEKWIRCLF